MSLHRRVAGIQRIVAFRAQVCAGLQDRRLLAAAIPLGFLSFVTFGFVAALIPNPIFGRSVAPSDAARTIWIASGPLMGVILATYVVAPPAAAGGAVALVPAVGAGNKERDERRSSTLGSLAGLGAFLAIGCPVCNKIALLLLGTSGALTIWAPLQPVVGAASLALLTATAAWRLKMRSNGNSCSVPVPRD